jgi:UDP:flavonoid glycosyltransferase YjiC (YdhE family)
MAEPLAACCLEREVAIRVGLIRSQSLRLALERVLRFQKLEQARAQVRAAISADDLVAHAVDWAVAAVPRKLDDG